MNEEQNMVGDQASQGEHFHHKEVSARQNVLMRGDKVFPGGDSASLRRRGNPVTAKNVANSLIRQMMAQVGDRTDDAIITPASVLSCHSHHQSFHFRLNRGAAGYCRCLEPSNFLATSLRYQARIVSGFATQAHSSSPLRPLPFPLQ